VSSRVLLFVLFVFPRALPRPRRSLTGRFRRARCRRPLDACGERQMWSVCDVMNCAPDNSSHTIELLPAAFYDTEHMTTPRARVRTKGLRVLLCVLCGARTVEWLCVCMRATAAAAAAAASAAADRQRISSGPLSIHTYTQRKSSEGGGHRNHTTRPYPTCCLLHEGFMVFVPLNSHCRCREWTTHFCEYSVTRAQNLLGCAQPTAPCGCWHIHAVPTPKRTTYIESVGFVFGFFERGLP
jgi:hypothetical protein